MVDNVDVKALRAKFHAQAEETPSTPGALSRPRPAGHLTEASDNGVVRSKLSPITPRPEPKKLNQIPHGVFPRPPPSQRVGAKEDLKPPVTDTENTGKIKLTGELLQNRMLQHIEKKPHPFPKSLLPSQRSLSEVAPLRKPIPIVGTRPTKSKRPPSVCLDRFYVKGPAPPIPGRQENKIHAGPVRPPRAPFTPTQPISNIHTEHEQDTYDDIDLPPPPPPPPKLPSESWTGSFSSQADDDSDGGEIYEHIEDLEEMEQPPVPERKKQKEHKLKQELEKREQKERLKKENEYRKKFKLTKEEEVLHIARVREDWQGGKNDLRVHQGECVEIVRVKNNPEGKWLARNMNGEYGYISNTCVDVDYEEVKRKLRKEAAPFSIPAPVSTDEDVYDDIGSDLLNSSLNLSGEVYDDVDHNVSEDFPLPPPEICLDPRKSKKLEKEEKEFRKKFKFEGPTKVLCCMMVDPNANIKKAGGKDLTVLRGEILEVIQQTSEKKVLCRNQQGKYGYVPRSYLLLEENEIYDDIDHMPDVYDNDAPLRS
ncbi:FYN-binding protein 1 isoform X2 [Trichomycterus rosablanca]|uniref:FYN-binding protein 1 isoform X2 n=1 Tax=Trichomycterus rosablanca TaxID=2290929 RepID=UPI002F35D854